MVMDFFDRFVQFCFKEVSLVLNYLQLDTNNFYRITLENIIIYNL